MASEAESARGAEQVRIQLSTRDPQLELAEQLHPFLVSTALRRTELSSLVNTLLPSESTIPLEFLIKEKFLRTSLSEFLTEQGISAETILQVEYVRAVLPPTESTSFEHDDWVGSVDVLSNTSPACLQSASSIQSGHERILSGSYDGLLRVWDMSGRVVATSKPPPDDGRLTCITAARFVTPSLIVSGGYDARLRIWNYENDSSSISMLRGSASNPSLTVSHELYGHRHFINSIAIHSPSKQILSASEDHSAMLWSTESPLSNPSLPPAAANLSSSAPSQSDLPNLNGNKRTKRNPGSLPSAGPMLTLRGHRGPVAAAIFKTSDHTVAYTASDDRTVKTWDLITGAMVTSRTPLEHVCLSCLCAVPSLGLLAVGTHMRSVVLVDPRANATHSVVMTLKGHKNQVSALAAQPAAGQDSAGGASSYGLLSGSFDGTCRIWDLRNAKAGVDEMGTGSSGGASGGAASAGKIGSDSYRIARESNPASERVPGGLGVKVFDVHWDQTVGIVSGGEDKRVQINRFSGDGINGGGSGA